jgi:SAM-dependent methyltransferase
MTNPISLADNQQTDSLANRLRRKRFSLFLQLVSPLTRPVRILDVGGTPGFWTAMGVHANTGFDITVLNMRVLESCSPHIRCVIGDACSMKEYSNNSFDVVFSNSVIEHLETWEAQKAMASEVMRISSRYFVQTPNRYFPIEPHFLFPFWQFFPYELRVWIIMRFSVGWYGRILDHDRARKEVASIKLLSCTELKELFPHSKIHKEFFLGLTKSMIAYGGWQS